MTKKKKRIGLGNIILVLMLLAGMFLLLYPSFSDYWNSFHQSRAISSYIEHVTKIDTSAYEEILASARKYNAGLNTGKFRWFLSDEEKEDYESELSLDESGAMGFLTIDKINVQLPIYHGVNESVLQTSIGHIEWTSLPVGGESSHCVLSGHRGLPRAKLFSDLDKLVVGDVFSLNVLNATLTYQVDQIRVVEPDDVSYLQIEEGKDYCTLVTCTPYGINSHRLLVRGHRIDNPMGDAKVVADAMQIDKIYVVPFVGVPILLILLILLFFSTGKHARHRDTYSEICSWEEEFRRSPEEKNSADSADL